VKLAERRWPSPPRMAARCRTHWLCGSRLVGVAAAGLTSVEQLGLFLRARDHPARRSQPGVGHDRGAVRVREHRPRGGVRGEGIDDAAHARHVGGRPL